ncbi:P-loop containing nucleoside triphosphate hydrolase protein [Suhomyces tanzawaensis NRRL Y-17324]|uniref:RNA helicase n=1 Tax=Suhomyces tanzawaensis NRRL Y-17324 TaxID=984487 RepID=A0A1E4SQL6_9ASCO|nr:P-loop containing nucleoside triphosphate hydrolase protein [Suhomyces tanzawaensis NRRL Y-17324]ODV81788.1 P-loop containing nucleoside triphosphate hydrolase protein [Suhomyces tanzawaensis NRRL Y-17324]
MPLNRKQIAVTQPRRVAAASLAARVSEEFGCQIGHEVGYQVRFSNVTHPHKTKLKYLTDGMLLRELMIDGKLSKYSTIILDEAHERTVLTDLIMGFLKQLLVSKQRTDLKVIVMSATLNAELFSKFFNDAPILFVEGKMYPVGSFYLTDSNEDIVDTMIRTVIQVNRSEQEGDVLCFLPGQEEIDNCVQVLTQLAPHLPKDSPIIVPLPLYAQLSPNQQAKIFEKLPARRRKVILATNIAETSITVSGVKYVIDSGLRKVKVWKHQLGLSTLLTTPISKASAKQRAGRAGRESAGKVFRLYLEKTFDQFPKQQESEIIRNDIILPILTLKKLQVDDLLNWSWLEHPGQEAILSALNTLYSLGALNDSGKITSLGYKMAVLPLPPQLSVVLITAMEFGVLNPVIDIVACLSVDNLLLNVGGSNGEVRDEVNYKRRQFCPLGCKFGDLIALKEYFNYFMETNSAETKAWCKELFFSYKGFKNVMKVRHQLRDYMIATVKQDDSMKQHERDGLLRKVKLQLDDEEQGEMDIPKVLKSFLKGYITNTAIGMPDRSYRTFNTGQLISIHPSSNLFGKVNLDCVMYLEYVFTAKGYGRNCSAMELGWLQEIAPHILGASKISIANS